MANRKSKAPPEISRTRKTATAAEPVRSSALRPWHIVAAVTGVFLAALFLYAPALDGPFVFDDRYLPFLDPNTVNAPLRAWLGVRQLLMFSYWVTYQMWGLDPFPYHLVNVLLHAANSALMFFVVRRYAELAGEVKRRAAVLAGVAAAVFLVHPVNTEAVAYVASRSEVLSVFFALAALVLFVSAPAGGIGFGRAAAIAALLGAGVTTKEHIMAVPAVFVLTDWFRGRFEALRRNWKLYALLLAGGVAAGLMILRLLRTAPMIGFKLEGLSWHEYLFTQFRAVWTYLRLYVLPVGLNIDHDMPVSRTLFDHGAAIGLVALVALLALAWWYRRQFPLAGLGLLMFLVLLAPTSSIVPIRDVVAERRMYLPFVGLLLITIDLLRRLRWSDMRLIVAGGAAVFVLAGAAYARNAVWGDPMKLWQDTAAKSPGKVRPHFQLAQAYYEAGNCSESAEHYAATARLEKPTYEMLLNWALALDCAGRPVDALARLRQAAQLERTAHVHATMAMVLGKAGRNDEALAELETAEKIDPTFSMTYFYRGNVFMQRGEPARALEQFRTAAQHDPSNQAAQQAAVQAERQVRAMQR